LDKINTLRSDSENLEFRRRLHENYEWLEAYWKEKFPTTEFDGFCMEYGQYYWAIPEIKSYAIAIVKLPPVGNSKNEHYNPSQNILQATASLKCSSELFKVGDISVSAQELSDAELWSNKDFSAFHALMTIVRQIRNNLFHGKKMDMEPEQYRRNKQLVQFSAEITEKLLFNLYEAESYRN
jgi:hypothetical protein